VRKKNREWWECTNRACGHKIEFLMLNVGGDKANPACFCGSTMKRAYVKPGYKKGAGALVTESSGVRAAKVLFSCSFYSLS
jgi:hypothetical protein